MESKALIRVRRIPPKGFGTMLRRARTRAGLSQGEAARAAGIPQPYLSVLEAGQRVPSQAVAYALASALGLGVNECRKLYEVAVSDAGRSHPNRVTA